MRLDQSQLSGNFGRIANFNVNIFNGQEWEQTDPEETHPCVVNEYPLCSNHRNLMPISVRVKSVHRAFCQQLFVKSIPVRREGKRVIYRAFWEPLARAAIVQEGQERDQNGGEGSAE